jgi:hypothetical protein
VKKLLVIGITTLLFAGGGFAYYYFVGCTSGSCAIASSPVLSTALGAVVGVSVGYTFSDRKDTDANL